jgi:FkbM family methyltransferase
LIAALKSARAFPPLNAVLTQAVRALLRRSGVPGELAIKHLPHVGTTRAQLPNGRTAQLRSRGDDWISNQVFWRGWDGYEPETTPVYWRLARASKVTLDVGAHVGFHSILAALANESSSVFAFEPLPVVFERLESNLRLNQLRNVTAIPAAAGALDGFADFFHVPGVIPSSSSLSEDFMQDTPGVASMRVQVMRIDTLANEHGFEHVDLIKIDTETGESDVLAGMQATLRSHRPDVICEVLTRSDGDALTAVLEPLGYRFYLLTPDGPRRRDAIVGDPRWLNYLFTARESV